jgi:hypothetical protein
MATASETNTFTMMDEAIAIRFAEDAINQMLCEDPAVNKAYCKGITDMKGGKCLRWQPDPSRQMWTLPYNFSSVPCQSAADCGKKANDTLFQPHCVYNADMKQKLCAYNPTEIKSGMCQIASRQKCNEYAAPPYDCNADKTECELKKEGQHFQWRTTENITCSTDRPCPSRNSQCLEDGSCSCSTDDDCWGTATCQSGKCQGGGRCVYGNFLLQQWCENPRSRCQKDEDDKYPEECSGGAKAKGVTEVPPFFFDTDSGRCFMSKPYCDAFARDFTGKGCSKDSECAKDEKCHAGHCTGPRSECTKKDIDVFWEMTFGRTAGKIFSQAFGSTDAWEQMFTDPAGYNKRWSCEGFDPKVFTLELFDEVRSWMDDLLEKMPPKVEVLVDPEAVMQKEVITRDYIPGTPQLPLYYLVWSYEVDQVYTPTFGFLEPDLRQRYPQFLKKHADGFWYLHMTWKTIRKDQLDLKRLYMIAAAKDKMATSIVTFLMSKLTAEEKRNLDRIINTYESQHPGQNLFA